MSVTQILLLSCLPAALVVLALAVALTRGRIRRPALSSAGIYNACMLLGVLLVGLGVGVWQGPGPALAVAGALVLALTIYVVETTRRAR